MGGTGALALVLIIFLLSIALTLFLVLHKPLRLRIPIRTSWTEFNLAIPLSYCWAPVLGALLCWATTAISSQDVGEGIKGDEHIQPYGILILFMSLAYIAASLDATGVFAWLALHITAASKGRGHVLFFLYYMLSAAMTTFTGNDVSIMTLTPIIIYFSRATGCDPLPFLTAEFVASNVWSMLLFVGNPTNIIVAQAYDLSFIGYTQWMALPTVVAGLACIVHLYLGARSHLPSQLSTAGVEPSHLLTDRLGAVVGSANLAVCLVLLSLAPTLHWDMWLITLICALVHAAYNFLSMVVWRESGPWGSRNSPGWALYQQHYNTQEPAPYAASTADEETADAILAREVDMSMYYRPPRPSRAFFLLSFLARLQYTLGMPQAGHGTTSRGAGGAGTEGSSGSAASSPGRAGRRRTAGPQSMTHYQHHRLPPGSPPDTHGQLQPLGMGHSIGRRSMPHHVMPGPLHDLIGHSKPPPAAALSPAGSTGGSAADGHLASAANSSTPVGGSASAGKRSERTRLLGRMRSAHIRGSDDGEGRDGQYQEDSSAGMWGVLGQWLGATGKGSPAMIGSASKSGGTAAGPVSNTSRGAPRSKSWGQGLELAAAAAVAATDAGSVMVPGSTQAQVGHTPAGVPGQLDASVSGWQGGHHHQQQRRKVSFEDNSTGAGRVGGQGDLSPAGSGGLSTPQGHTSHIVASTSGCGTTQQHKEEPEGVQVSGSSREALLAAPLSSSPLSAAARYASGLTHSGSHKPGAPAESDAAAYNTSTAAQESAALLGASSSGQLTWWQKKFRRGSGSSTGSAGGSGGYESSSSAVAARSVGNRRSGDYAAAAAIVQQERPRTAPGAVPRPPSLPSSHPGRLANASQNTAAQVAQHVGARQVVRSAAASSTGAIATAGSGGSDILPASTPQPATTTPAAAAAAAGSASSRPHQSSSHPPPAAPSIRVLLRVRSTGRSPQLGDVVDGTSNISGGSPTYSRGRASPGPLATVLALTQEEEGEGVALSGPGALQMPSVHELRIARGHSPQPEVLHPFHHYHHNQQWDAPSTRANASPVPRAGSPSPQLQPQTSGGRLLKRSESLQTPGSPRAWGHTAPAGSSPFAMANSSHMSPPAATEPGPRGSGQSRLVATPSQGLHTPHSSQDMAGQPALHVGAPAVEPAQGTGVGRALALGPHVVGPRQHDSLPPQAGEWQAATSRERGRSVELSRLEHQQHHLPLQHQGGASGSSSLDAVIVVQDGVAAGRRQAVTDNGVMAGRQQGSAAYNQGMNQGYLPTSSGILQGDGGVPAQTVHPGQVVVVVKGGEDGLSTKATLQDEEHLHQRSTAGVDVEWEEAGEQQQGEGEEGEGQQLEPLKPPPRSFVRTFTCLPWEVVPFVLGMFILVQGLKAVGLVGKLASGLGQAAGSGKLGGALALMGWLSVFLANILNNQPMTILMAQVALEPGYIQAIAEHTGELGDNSVAASQLGASNSTISGVSMPQASAINQASLFALVVGSNVGALFTLVGALAGIMWANILRGMGVHMDYLSFARIMLPLGITSTVVTLAMLWLEFATWGSSGS